MCVIRDNRLYRKFILVLFLNEKINLGEPWYEMASLCYNERGTFGVGVFWPGLQTWGRLSTRGFCPFTQFVAILKHQGIATMSQTVFIYNDFFTFMDHIYIQRSVAWQTCIHVTFKIAKIIEIIFFHRGLSFSPNKRKRKHSSMGNDHNLSISVLFQSLIWRIRAFIGVLQTSLSFIISQASNGRVLFLMFLNIRTQNILNSIFLLLKW